MLNYFRILLITIVFSIIAPIIHAQSSESLIQKYLNTNQIELGLSSSDINNWSIADEHSSNKFNIKYVYIKQNYNGISIQNGLANFVIKDSSVVMTADELIRNISSKTNSTEASITPKTAVIIASEHLNINISKTLKEISKQENNNYLFNNESISRVDIPVKQKYFSTDSNTIRLVWELSIYMVNKQDWWSINIDANSGQLLSKNNWVDHCNFKAPHTPSRIHSHPSIKKLVFSSAIAPSPTPSSDSYNVFAMPVESPNHGSRSIVIGPADLTASPYGWHDIDGNDGAEYTITRGNNVHAMEDENGNNGTGNSPNGTASLDFDFPLNINQAPANYLDPSVTNLFYWNNIIHDIWYQYGFDEASGNFQENNYGKGGSGSDYVYADAQDGNGSNNANFGTPADGGNPRMQMYLWDAPATANLLTINSPSNLSGSYNAIEAGIGPGLTSTITADFALYNDNINPDPEDACEDPINAAELSNKIVIIRRGSCNFSDKILRAQNAGALAVIMVNNTSGASVVMGGDGTGITIPSVMVEDIDGEPIISALIGNTIVNGTLAPNNVYELDGDFDNGIIAHEYGHGISNRLTGGRTNANCLDNAEQMGEGWSDWFALMLTIEPEDNPEDKRGIGTYVIGESTSGDGIRPAPYSTDFSVNNFTYDATNNTSAISEPHGIGFVWSTMLWDLTWALINKHGYSSDLYNGTRGNNIAMHLVINGLKIQPCNPGFIDGRDAILEADRLLYNSENHCAIWNAFANRGLGYSASQGNANSRTDQTEAFDLPPALTNSTGSETTNICGSYTWAANSITYTESGTYEATVTNHLGCDSVVTLNLTITDDPNNSNGNNETITECDSYTWTTNNQTYTTTGNYSATLTNVNGCDSIVTLNLTINNSNSGSENITECNTYTWSTNSQTYTTSGNYSATLTNVDGCDSIATLNLTINDSNSGSENITECDNYTWSANSQNYTTSGNYSATLTNVNGCDSIATLNLTIDSSNSGSENITECDNYTWSANSQTYTTSGNYSATLTNVDGCDSVATLNLTINNSNSGSENITECDNYTWSTNNQTYSTSGNYSATLTNVNGCDSITTLYLIINSSNSGTENIIECDNYTWSANSQTYTTSGNYSVTLTNVDGCDSIATLNLTINNSNSGTEYITECNTYTWSANNQTYTTTGNYSTTLANVNGCDSIATLNLTIDDNSSGSETTTACNTYTWAANSQTYETSGNYSTTLTNVNGCDSIATLNLTIDDKSSGSVNITECNSYTWSANNQTYETSGNYSATLTNINGCDSTINLNLNIINIDTSISQINDTTLNIVNTDATSYQWLDCGDNNTPIKNSVNQSFIAIASGSYAVEIIQGGCIDTSLCYEIVIEKVLSSIKLLKVYPNPTNGLINVELGKIYENVRALLYDKLGQVIIDETFYDTDLFELTITGASANYLLKIEADELKGNFKIIKTK